MVKKAVYFCLLILFISEGLLAQRKSELFSLRYSYFADNEVNDVFLDSPFGGLEVGVQDLQLKGNIPVTIGSRTHLSNHIQYNFLNFNFQNWPNTVPESEQVTSLHGLSYTLDLSQDFGKGWSARVMLQPGLASSFDGGISGDDFIFQGNAIFYKSFQADEQLVLGLGASYNTLFGEEMLLPVLDFYWKTGKLEMDVFFPYYGKVYYEVASTLRLGLEGFIEGNQYNLSNPPDQDYLQFNTIYGGPTIKWNFAQKLYWQVSGGILINRTHEVFTETDRVNADFDPDKFQPFYLQTKIGFEFQ